MFNKNDYKTFAYFSTFWLIIAWLSLVLTMSNFFYQWVFVAPIFILLLLKGRNFTKNILNISKFFILINVTLLILIALFAYFFNPTIFSGRDQGSISQASIRLTEFHKLKFSTSVSKDFFEINSGEIKNKYAHCLENNKIPFKKIYCDAFSSGKALNFPGFYYTSEGYLVTQFPLGYISWLAFFYIFFGLNGFIIANAILFYIFCISFLFILEKLIKNFSNFSRKTSIFICLLTILTTFPFVWFFKFTLSENMVLAFLWLSIFQLINIINSKKNITLDNFLIFFLTSSFLIFSRIEGILFFTIMFFILFLHKNSSGYLRKNFKKIILPALVFVGIIFLWNIKSDIYFYKSIIKVIYGTLENSSTLNAKSAFSVFNLFKIFSLYGLLIFFFLGFLEIIFLSKNKYYQILIPFLVTSPTLFYLFNPQITPDHPWMLRRFFFAVFPMAILYSMILINRLIEKKYYLTIMLLLLLIFVPNFYLFKNYAFFKLNNNLLSETKKISNQFSEKDLILVDRMASGSNWNMIADPMNFIFKKNSVYLFDSKDLNKLNIEKYDKIYLIVPEYRQWHYINNDTENNLKFVSKYIINNTIMENNSLNKIVLPKKIHKETKGIIFEITDENN